MSPAYRSMTTFLAIKLVRTWLQYTYIEIWLGTLMLPLLYFLPAQAVPSRRNWIWSYGSCRFHRQAARRAPIYGSFSISIVSLSALHKWRFGKIIIFGETAVLSKCARPLVSGSGSWELSALLSSCEEATLTRCPTRWKNRTDREKRRGEFQPTQTYARPYHMIAIDFIGRLPLGDA
ncbi:hypothetical protein V8C43DRAFT_30269 [Trichoderma afarasin]